MARRSDRLERGTLLLFRLACKQERLDVAEHFLRALETLQRKPGRQDPTRCQWALMGAYDELACRR
jgi:hypothetical protein